MEPRTYIALRERGSAGFAHDAALTALLQLPMKIHLILRDGCGNGCSGWSFGSGLLHTFRRGMSWSVPRPLEERTDRGLLKHRQARIALSEEAHVDG